MPIWFDYREKALLKLAPTVKELTPPVGDIWIGDLSGASGTPGTSGASGTNLQAGGVILERKTAADLEASIIDGRYKEQRGRLLAYSKEYRVAFGYVIEGDLDRLGARLDESALLKHITRLQFHHRIPVVQTASAKETVRLAELIEAQWIKDGGKFAWECLSDTTNAANSTAFTAASYIKSACRDSPDTFLLGTLTQCRGISEALARLIMSKYPTLEKLMTATAEELASVSEGKRKVGKAVAERLHGLLHTVPNTVQLKTP